MLVDVVGGKPVAKITDFGRAYMIDHDESSKNILGNCVWTAKEVLLYEDSDGRVPLTKYSDVWSFAITVLEVGHL